VFKSIIFLLNLNCASSLRIGQLKKLRFRHYQIAFFPYQTTFMPLLDSPTTTVFAILVTRIVRVLFIIMTVLTCLSILGQFSTYFLGHGRLYGFVDEFYLDEEKNIPTYFSSIILLTSSFLLMVIYKITKQHAEAPEKNWLILSVVFLYLSIDEFSSIHEMLNLPLREFSGNNGLYYIAWIIPGALITLALGIYFLKFLMRLPQQTRKQFIIAGSVYVGGALGVELLGGFYAFDYTQDNFSYSMIATLEEVMEMTGVILFIRALLRYLLKHTPQDMLIQFK